MKNTYKIYLIAFLLVLTGTQCTEGNLDNDQQPEEHVQPEPQPEPELHLDYDSLNVPYYGKTNIINYTIDHPVEGQQLTANCAEPWIQKIEITEDRIIFESRTHLGTVAREAVITFNYNGQQQKTELTIRQAYNEQSDFSAEIGLKSSHVDLPAEGGSTEIRYSLINVEQDSPVTAHCEEDWIQNLTVQDRNICISAEANHESRKRTATIIVECEEFQLANAIYVTQDPLNGKFSGQINVNGTTFQMIKVETGSETNLADYYIGQREVNQKLWTAVMGYNPSYYSFNACNPVENITYTEIETFIEKLNVQTGWHFSLPTEKEWEYAARGGNKTRNYLYSGSNNLDEVGWYSANAEGYTHPTAWTVPNELGLYDMSGNVWEWCSDHAEDGVQHIIRGGSINNTAEECRIDSRQSVHPENKDSGIPCGFRLILRIE